MAEQARQTLSFGKCSKYVGGLAIVISIVVFAWSLNWFIPYYDYDSSSMAVFVNNVAAGRGHDFFFADSAMFQDQYRAAWATQWIPLSTAISWGMRLLRLPPCSTLLFLKFLGLGFAVLGAAAVAVLYAKIQRFSPLESALGACICLTAPTFFLFSLSAITNIMMVWFLCWCIVLCFCLHVRTGRNRWLYLTAIPAGLGLLIPYPFVFVLPAFAIIYLGITKKIRLAVTNRHTYGSLLLTIVVSLVMLGLSLWATGTSPARYVTGIRKFYRSRTVATGHRSFYSPIPRIRCLWRAFVLGKATDNIDGRWEKLWFLDAVHIPWLLVLAAAGWGLVSIRRKDWREHEVDLALLGGHLIVFGLLYYVTGRYMLLLTPVVVSLAIAGIRRIVPQEAGRIMLLSALSIVVCGYTLYLAVTVYNPMMLAQWTYCQGIEEAAVAIDEDTDDDSLPTLFNPGHDNYATYLLVMAMTDFKVYTNYAPRQRMFLNDLPPGAKQIRMFELVPAGNRARTDHLLKLGWTEYRAITDRYSGARYVLMRTIVGVPRGS